MKQKIDRITTGAKSISLRTLAMVLCFVMLLSAIGVGTVVTAIAKSSNAKAAAAGALSRAVADVAVEEDAEDDDDVVVSKKGDSDLAGVGANMDLAGTGWGFAGHNRIYYENTDSWTTVGLSFAGGWYEMGRIANTGIYEYWIDGSWTNDSQIKFSGDYKESSGFDVYLNYNDDMVFNKTAYSTDENNLNGTAEIVTMIDSGSGTYIKSSDAGCVATISGIHLPAGWTVTESTSASTGNDADTATIYPAYGSSVSYSAESSETYTFMGFSTESNSTLPIVSDSYGPVISSGGLNTASPAKVYAYFKINDSYYVASGDSSLTGNSWDVDDPLGEMSLSSGTTYTKSFTGIAAGTYQFRITDGTNYVTDSSTGTATGNVLPTKDGNNFKFTLGATDTSWTVTITYNSDTKAVTVNALEAEEEEETSGWKYTADNTDATPEIEGTPDANWGYAYGTNTSNQADIPKFIGAVKSSNDYWADISDISMDGFYFGLTSSRNSAGIQGSTSSIQVNDVSKSYTNNNSSANQIAFSDSGTSLFTVEIKQHGSVAGNKLYLQIHTVNKSKVSGIGVKATYSGSGAVNYKFYYKLKGEGGNAKNQDFMVYAKDGTITETEYGFGKYADTTISDTKSTSYTRNETDAHDEDYYTGTFTLGKTDETGNTLTITTTVDETDRAKMYVKGWSVNGTTYGYNVSDTVANDGVYTTSIKVTYEDFRDAPENDDDEKIIEITPIYYLVGAKTVPFRVENFDEEVQKTGGWGSTLYAYPFYGALNNVDNSFGAYPGQPLIYYNGKYSIQIPMESISLKDPDTDGTIVRGITLNNGYFDNAHKDAYGWTSTSQHKQTYDFDDFYKIYNEKNANDIIFRFKYRDTKKTYNRENYFKTGKTTLTDTDISNLEADKGWEVLKDRAGRVIDIFGNPLKQTDEPSKYATDIGQISTAPVHVVSMGYFDNNAGEYATEWVIFNNDENNTRIQSGASTDYKFSIVPSALLLNNNTRFATTVYTTYRDKPVGYYKDLYDTLKTPENALGKPAVIAYERDQLRENNAMRSDGRWYYTTNTDFVQSNIKIQYKTPAGTYVNDTYATNEITDVTGVTTGAKAYFTNTKYENKRQSLSEIYSAETKDNYTFEAVDGENYQFAGWFIEVDGDTDKPTYTPINPDASGNYAVARTSSDVLVARFDPIKAGTVKIAHTVTAGSGTAEVKVEFGTGESYTTLRDFGTASYTVSSSYIKATNNAKNVKITLKTTAGTDHTFNKFDASASTKAVTTYFPDDTGTTSGSVTTKEIVIPVSTILANNTSSLTYYSLLDAPTYKYEITYQFTSTRLKTDGDENATLTYTSKGVMTSKAYEKNVTISGDDRRLSTQFISDVAPYESNFKQILSYGAGNIQYPDHGYTKVGTTYTQKATVTFVAQDDKNITGVISLPYQWKSTDDAYFAPSETYIDYSSINSYTTEDPAPSSTKDGILEDHSSEAFNIYTVYGGYFVAGDNKTSSFNFYDDNNQKYIIKAPEEILGSSEKQVTKYTIDSNGNGLWSYYGEEGSVAYEAEIKRILGIEGKEDTPDNRAEVRSKYTTPSGKKCYRVSTETHYVPDNTTKYFQYWSIQNTDQKEVARCYYTKLNYLAFENYFITPVYGASKLASPNAKSATISYLGESRNQWNYDGGSSVKTGTSYGLMDATDSKAADYIWEDFAVEFQYNGEELNKYAGNNNIKVGVVIQKAGDRVEGVTSPEDYRALYKDTESIDNVKNFVKNKVLNQTESSYSGKYMNQPITLSNLNNKNREDYFLRIANSYDWSGDAPANVDTKYSGSAMRVYSYITDGEEVYVSPDPAYFCTYGIANQ